MEEKWNLGKPAQVCSRCGEEIRPGESLVSALSFTGVEFERLDFCEPCWENVRQEDLYSHWRTRVPEKEEKPRARRINIQVVDDLFQRLREEADEARRPLIFLLAMILVQKRVLKYRETRRAGGKNVLVLERPRTDTVYEVEDPGVERERLDAMREELKDVLESE